MKPAKGALCLYIALISCAFIFLESCESTKSAVYFNGSKDTVLQSEAYATEDYIHANDLLSITISSLNPEATSIFNTPNNTGISSTAINGNSTQAFGYLVNKTGNIQFPILGNIKAAGLTKEQLKDTISQSLVKKELLIDPVVVVRVLNFKVTVLGEVAKPAVYAVPSEKISLLEAIGLAGDLTIYGKRENVMVIREEGNQKITKRLNLNSSELFTSPYYYLKSNDIVYIEPNKNRIAGSRRSLVWAPVIASIMSLAVVIATRL